MRKGHAVFCLIKDQERARFRAPRVPKLSTTWMCYLRTKAVMSLEKTLVSFEQEAGRTRASLDAMKNTLKNTQHV